MKLKLEKQKLPKFAMFVSPKTFSDFYKGPSFFYKKENGKRRYQLPLMVDFYAPNDLGFAVYFGRYIGAFNLKKLAREE